MNENIEVKKPEPVFLLWKGPETRLSLQEGGVSATLHFKAEHTQPFKVPGELWPFLKKKISDALMTKKCIVISGNTETERKVQLEKELETISKPDIANLKTTSVSWKRKKIN